MTQLEFEEWMIEKLNDGWEVQFITQPGKDFIRYMLTVRIDGQKWACEQSVTMAVLKSHQYILGVRGQLVEKMIRKFEQELEKTARNARVTE